MRSRIKRQLAFLSFLANAGIALGGGPPRQQAKVLDTTSIHPIHLSYLLFLPASYAADSKTEWPLILYLHGGSLRGDDVERVRTLGLPHKLENEPEFPFVVVSPQCSTGEIWSDPEAIELLLDRIIAEYHIDQRRLYVTGHSMGGRGALYFAYRLPTRFAAVVAVSPSSPITSWGARLAQTPLWLLHGTADAQAAISDSQELIDATKAAGGHPRFDRLEGRDHYILDTYDRHDIYEWLLQQKR